MSLTQAVEEPPARKARTSNLAVSAMKGIGNRLGLRTPSSARPPTAAPAPSSRPMVDAPAAPVATPLTGDDPGMTSSAVHAPESAGDSVQPTPASEAPRKTLGYAIRSNASKIAEGRFSDIKVTGKTFKNSAADARDSVSSAADHAAGYVAGTNTPEHLKPEHEQYQGDNPAGQYVRMSDGMGGYQWKPRAELSEAQIAKADMPKGPSLKGDAAIAAHATAGGMNFVAKSMMGANKQTPEERMNESPLKAALQGALGSGAELLKSAGGSVAEGLSGGLVEGEGASEAVGHLGSMAGWGVRGLSKATMNATKPAADQQRLRRHVANLYTEKGKGELTEHHKTQVMPEFGAALRARQARVALDPSRSTEARTSAVPDWAKEQYRADHPAKPAAPTAPTAPTRKPSMWERFTGAARRGMSAVGSGLSAVGRGIASAAGRAKSWLSGLFS